MTQLERVSWDSDDAGDLSPAAAFAADPPTKAATKEATGW
jgi:hypothetical protein